MISRNSLSCVLEKVEILEVLKGWSERKRNILLLTGENFPIVSENKLKEKELRYNLSSKNFHQEKLTSHDKMGQKNLKKPLCRISHTTQRVKIVQQHVAAAAAAALCASK